MRPQGDFVAFTVMTIVEQENTRHREIWLQPLRHGKAADSAFRFTSPTENSGQPRWSPASAELRARPPCRADRREAPESPGRRPPRESL